MTRSLIATLVLSLALAMGAIGCDDDDDDGNNGANNGADIGFDIGFDVGDVDDDVGDVSDDAGDVDGDTGAPTANLQVIHASPDPAAAIVDVYVNDVLTLDDISYLDATGFLPVPAGNELNVDVTAADAEDNSEPVHSQTFSAAEVAEDATLVAIASGMLDDNFSIRVSEAQLDAAEGQVALKLFHGAPDAPAVDVTAADGALPLAEDLAFGAFSDIINAPAVDVTVDITSAADDDPIASVAVPLSGFGGEYLTAIARGTLADDDDADFGVTAFTADGTSVDLQAP